MIVAALYVARSLQRGSWRPEMPMDAVLLLMVGFVMLAVARIRSIAEKPDEDSDAQDEGGASRTDAEGPTRS